MYFCIEDSVANDYRFLARMRNEQSFLKLFIWDSEFCIFFYPDFFHILTIISILLSK